MRPEIHDVVQSTKQVLFGQGCEYWTVQSNLTQTLKECMSLLKQPNLNADQQSYKEKLRERAQKLLL